MNRFVRLAAIVLVVGFAGACDQKGGPLKVERVEPPEGIVAGGDQIYIVGSGFQPGKTQVEVRFGRRKAEQVVIESGSKISVKTPAGDKGPVDVHLAFDDGSAFKLSNAFRYVQPQAQGDMRKAFFTGKPGEEKK